MATSLLEHALLINAFLLTKQWHDTPNGITLEFWCLSDSGPICIEIEQQEAVIFVRVDDLPAVAQHLRRQYRAGNKYFKNYLNERTCPLYFQSYRAARDAESRLQKYRIPVWEADIRPPERFLMERFITGGLSIEGDFDRCADYQLCKNPRLSPCEYQPQFRSLSIDIETTMDANTLYSIAAYNPDINIVFIVQHPDWPEETTTAIAQPSDQSSAPITVCLTEKDCLLRFFQWLQEYDPDILMGWNVVQFDLKVLDDLCQKHKIPLAISRGHKPLKWREDKDNRRFYLTVPGRVVLDGIEILKSATYNFPSFKLNDVAKIVVDDKKLIQSQHRGDEITQLYIHNPKDLAAYNLHDCKLVWSIFVETKLLEFAIARSQLTGLAMDKMGGSVASFEFAYLPQLHRKGYIAPNLGELQSTIISPGGYVLNSMPGIYQNVLVLDFKSLYPSIIRTFFIDPYSYWYAQHSVPPKEELVPGFNDAFFSKSEHLLPRIIKDLWQARDNAKKHNDQPLSQAIKIIMNSFYGVLGSTGCRFFDPRVCSSITLRGHQIIQQTQEWIEALGYQVIYGDTDSVFVWIGNEKSEVESQIIGNNLATQLNQNWQQQLLDQYNIDSALEVEFETHYLKFLMPTIRNSTLGSKKRYAGIIRKNGKEQLIFKGLESVRTDWTPLAKKFQETLYQLVFEDAHVEDFIRTTTLAVLAGERNHDLIYRKRLRRNIEDYQKNIPPHVQAAKRLSAQGIHKQRGDWISYLLTTTGPEPVDEDAAELQFQGTIAYNEYVERQLKPVADSVLQFIGLHFEDITAAQLPLFKE